MEIRAFRNNGHYKYQAVAAGYDRTARIVDDHGTNNNDYFISINPRKLNSSGGRTRKDVAIARAALVTQRPIKNYV